MDDLHQAIEMLHCEIPATNARKRRQAKSRAVQLQKFAIGDYLLVSQVSRQGNKLSLDWRGASKIVRVVADYITQELVQPFDLSLHHACRLTMHYEGGNDVT
ncbi:hypothetical protein DYB28_001867 [Aphanomyces astaci]|uniref:Integrase zinc-binding domain-containing protein n=1 Tax=Aphanomyces astaci TaxID=112090 RepID=A0A9X8H6K0_APHAT|nr:hypothetical protein DYB28_001867 [Aphanomyces astaci]